MNAIRYFRLKTVAALAGTSLLAATSVAQQRQITVDTRNVAGPNVTVFNECVGAGRANEGLRADWQAQLRMAKKELGFRYIRFHGLLHDDMHVYALGKDGKPIYNWLYVDRLFDFLVGIGVRPFVEFSFMPPDLASGTKTVFWWKGNVTKPKSYEEWDKLIAALVTHWKSRYGESEIAKWYYEVWNEPDLKGFFDGTQDDYFELYNHTATAVKSVGANLRVGGPATSATKWIPEFLAYCTSNKLPLDFISTHDYGTTSVLDEFGTKKQGLKSNPDTIAVNVKRIRSIVRQSAYPNAELHFTEWNTSPSSRDPLHDSYQSAAYILNTLKKTGMAANSMSYWTFTDIFEEAGPAQFPFHGGFGLFTLQDIRKPSYYAYKFLNELGDQELSGSDDASIVCKSARGVQALIWNYTHPSGTYKFDQDYFSQLQPAGKAGSVTLEVRNLPAGDYRLEIYRVGYLANDPFSAWLRMGKPADLSRAQVEELKTLSDGKAVSTSSVTVRSGSYKTTLHLLANDCYLLKINRIVK